MATIGHEERSQPRRARYQAPDVSHEMPLAQLLSRGWAVASRFAPDGASQLGQGCADILFWRA